MIIEMKKEVSVLNILEQYYAALDAEAHRMNEAAAEAKKNGDERKHSVYLMKASMFGEMLKVLGRVEHEGKRPNALETLIESFSGEAEKQRAIGDYDAMDRAEQKSAAVQFALDALRVY